MLCRYFTAPCELVFPKCELFSLAKELGSLIWQIINTYIWDIVSRLE